MRQPPDKFLLTKDKMLLGVANVVGIWDMFWFKIDFEPTEAFGQVESLFEKELRILNHEIEGNPESIWDEIMELGVRLVRDDDGTVIDSFMLHVEGDDTRLCYLEPSEIPDQD